MAGIYSFIALVTVQPNLLSSALGIDFECVAAKPKISVVNSEDPVKSTLQSWDKTAEETEERTVELDDE